MEEETQRQGGFDREVRVLPGSRGRRNTSSLV